VKSKILLFICSALLITSPAWSHHNFAAHYNVNESVEIAGVVTKFRFINPHARIYIDVKNEEGKVESWMVEGDASVALRRSGWTADQLKPGDRISIVGSPSRFGSNMLGWNSITLADGSTIGGGDGRLEERVQILEERLAQFRQQRGR